MIRSAPAFRLGAIVACAILIVASTADQHAWAAGGGGGSGSLSRPAPQQPKIDPVTAYRQGVSLLQAGEYKKAERKFKDVLRHNSKDARANYHMGLAKVGREKYKSARKYFERAIDQRDSYAEAREQLGRVHARLGDADKAQVQLDALKSMLAACQGNCDSRRMEVIRASVAGLEQVLGGASASAGERVGTLLFRPWADGDAAYQTAVAHINAGRYTVAIDELQHAADIIGPHPDILNYLGFAHRKLGRYDAALTYYGQALAVAPDHKGANEYLGELYLEMGDMERARAQLAKLDQLCAFGCAEREELHRWIVAKLAEAGGGR